MERSKYIVLKIVQYTLAFKHIWRFLSEDNIHIMQHFYDVRNALLYYHIKVVESRRQSKGNNLSFTYHYTLHSELFVGGLVVCGARRIRIFMDFCLED